MSGRPLSIDEQVEWRDPLDPKAAPVMLDRGEVIIRTVALGVPDNVACQAAGIHRSTLSRWKARAAEVEDLDPEALDEGQRRLRDFCNSLTRAEAQSVGFAVAMIHKAMPSDWRAAVALIERRFPGDFSKRVEVKVDPTERKPAPIDAGLGLRAEEAFAAAVGLPPDLSPDDFLPPIDAPAVEDGVE